MASRFKYRVDLHVSVHPNILRTISARHRRPELLTVNVFILCLREQLRHSKYSTTEMIEISPLPVGTELHDYMGEEAGRRFGMPLDIFT
ncbi:Pc22g20750 [Penicillium rubens Wisconsin 54-1255]|uniref:Pc22g20750 protein n=1 Tax=Penicillium rubens (strain ATCC 28089 / DSM 1075 / NRRL 1951 / Wisconsin 54-1255) TaxID=500485 RepID=B6HRL1_PENRW|nr:Pc22g20750 [Penicillium rubens Wisconsin 54-1255]